MLGRNNSEIEFGRRMVMTSRNVYSKYFTLRGLYLEIESHSIGMVQWFLFKCHRCSRSVVLSAGRSYIRSS